MTTQTDKKKERYIPLGKAKHRSPHAPRAESHLIWLQEEFLVVLAERTRKRDGFAYFQLVTAYWTPEEARKAKLRRERDEARNG